MDNALHSEVQGIKWPALPGGAGAARLATLFQLEQTQWWPEQQIRQHQFKQISTLLQHCAQHVPYYRKLLGASFKPGNLEQQWLKIPILTRDKIQQAGNTLSSERIPETQGKARLQRTSGSTGKPIETLGTDITLFFWNVFTLRDHLWHHRDLTKKLAVIRYTEDERAQAPSGMLAKNWGQATQGLYNTGNSAVLSIFTPVSEQVAWLQSQAPEYLLTHPSVLKEIAIYCQNMNIKLPSLQEVRTISESLPDGLRDLCNKVWGVPLIDMYSTVELGYLALQCPEHNHYHVQSEGVFIEVLDDNDKPCAPGETGRVIVTSLHNFAFPLIRYEVGDYAEMGEPCSCGRGLPVIKRILGRYRNMLRTESGEVKYPKLGIQDLYKIAPVQQFQALQLSLSEIEINLVLDRPLTKTEKETFHNKFQKSFGPDFHIEIKQVGSISRSTNGKYEEFLSKL